MIRTLGILIAFSISAATSVVAVSVAVNWSTDRGLVGRLGAPLTSGTSVDGDGALLQLGYFSLATVADPFAGPWTVLAVGSIGDQGGLADGYFSISTVFESGNFTEPAIGTPLGVRYFNGGAVGTSSYYNTGVNLDGTGLWVAADDPAAVINLELSKVATRFEDFSGSFQTSIPVPEPGTGMLCCMAAGALLLCRRRIERS